MATNILIGNETESPIPPRTQVYKATHDGELRLPFMYRSFISFSYGGKNIEDFNLIAYTNGDRLQRTAYGDFEDLTTTYDVIHGQFYWGTYFHSRGLTLDLATDGMTQQQLDEFRYWFRPGEARELILSEHPNRAIMARIAQPPELHLLPFEEPVTIKFNNTIGQAVNYKTSTTVYKGEITLDFVMDEPFWYSKQNILGKQTVVTGLFDDMWTDANGNPVNIRSGNPDALKIILEDRIPLGTDVSLSVFFGDNVFAFMSYAYYSQIASEISSIKYNEEIQKDDLTITNGLFYMNGEQGTVYYMGARIMENDATPETVQQNKDNEQRPYCGTIAGAQYEEGDNNEGITLSGINQTNNPSEYYLYYPGTAPSPVTIEFTITPEFDDEYYITAPYSSFHKSPENKPYNTITLKANKTFEFNFSLPSLWLNYNKALKILTTPDLDEVKIQERLNNEVKHSSIRKIVNFLLTWYSITNTNSIDTPFLEAMKESINTSATFTFNGKTGEARGIFQQIILPVDFETVKTNILNEIIMDQYYAPVIEEISNATSYNDLRHLSSQNSNYQNLINSKLNQKCCITINGLIENVGDMVKGKYLILDERNRLNNEYKVGEWVEMNDLSANTENYSYIIKQNLPMVMNNLKFIFKNMYL